MFLFLSKFLPQFIYPTGLVAVLIIIGIAFYKHPWAGRAALGLALAVLLITGNRTVSKSLARSLEWRHLPQNELPQAQAIVLLGGGTAPALHPRQTTEISDAGDRVLYAAWLYHQGKAPLILVTGGNLPWDHTPSTPAQEMVEILLRLDVPQEAILLEDKSVNTYENAVFSRGILEQAGIQQVLLVTSAMHMPRSVMLFEKQGVQVTPAPTDFQVIQGEKQNAESSVLSFLTNLMPTAQNIELTSACLREYIGILVYRLRGWV